MAVSDLEPDALFANKTKLAETSLQEPILEPDSSFLDDGEALPDISGPKEDEIASCAFEVFVKTGPRSHLFKPPKKSLSRPPNPNQIRFSAPIDLFTVHELVNCHVQRQVGVFLSMAGRAKHLTPSEPPFPFQLRPSTRSRQDAYLKFDSTGPNAAEQAASFATAVRRVIRIMPTVELYVYLALGDRPRQTLRDRAIQRSPVPTPAPAQFAPLPTLPGMLGVPGVVVTQNDEFVIIKIPKRSLR